MFRIDSEWIVGAIIVGDYGDYAHTPIQQLVLARGNAGASRTFNTTGQYVYFPSGYVGGGQQQVNWSSSYVSYTSGHQETVSTPRGDVTFYGVKLPMPDANRTGAYTDSQMAGIS